jgi:hypothetical protein
MFISEPQIQAAFDVLHDQAHAKARAAYEYASSRLKVVLAGETLKAEGKTVGDRDARAMISEEYQGALKSFHLIAQTYYLERDKRDAAAAVIDAWRTQQSDARAMGRVG